MKIVNVLCAATAAVVMMVSCDNEEPKKLPPLPIESGAYIGRVQVDAPFYEQDNVLVTFKDSTVATIIIHNVKFASNMPYLNDMTIDSISVTKTTNDIVLAGENLIPTTAGNPYAMYIITDLQGKVTSDSLITTMTCGSFPLSFRGKKQ
ncbi:hypothetical protein AGMMS49982_19120 [Bacteroidia bacterium]|nr:hypothetical protein AGMMS49982_19120 [Bacteroidia bacterium]